MRSLDRLVFRFFNLDIALRYLPRILKGMLVTLGLALAVGRPADVVVFDPDTVGAGPLARAYDLPAGAARLISKPRGMDAMVVNGAVLPAPGESWPAGVAFPGRLLRNGAAR